jgi:hypothetical protein
MFEKIDFGQIIGIIRRHHQQRPVGAPQHLRHPRLHPFRRQRRQVDELELHVLELRHPRRRRMRGEREWLDIRFRVRHRPQEARLAGIGRPQQRDLSDALFLNQVERRGARRTFFLVFLAQLRQLAADVGLQFLRALVLGQHGVHLLERRNALRHGFGPAEFLLGGQVIRSEIGWHGTSALRMYHCRDRILSGAPAFLLLSSQSSAICALRQACLPERCSMQ